MKTCTRCGATKPLTAFRYDKRRNAHHSWCRACHAEYNRAYRAAHRGYFRDYMKKYWQTHPRPRKPSRRDGQAERQRDTRRHDAIARRQNPRYAAAKRARYAAILARVGK